jgi:cardiolipin synthase A/B
VSAQETPARGAAMLDQAFTRAAGAALIQGNAVRLLRDATEHYPLWLEVIGAAERSVLLENYIFSADGVGRAFAEALAARARAGVRVRVIYDWVGSLGRAPARFWRGLRTAGVEVRSFNRPNFIAPFSWAHRDHRKMLAVDGRIGYITGLCIAREWLGDPARGLAPWRDTGVEVRGPALREIERAFAQVWSTMGAPLPAEELPSSAGPAEVGAVALRVVASAPGTAGVLRLDQLIAAAARRTLWLTDAYFAPMPVYLQGLRAAARDGVDVRLLVPGASDIPVLRPLSEAGFRPLLEAGVRVFAWKGSMLHAKTAVADGRWARVGSSNLNLASWMGNYELDALIEDEGFAHEMEQMYERDLTGSTELILERRRKRRPQRAQSRPAQPRTGGNATSSDGVRGGSATRAAAGALRISRTVGAALSEQRVLAPTEARMVAMVAVVTLVLAVIIVRWPLVAAVPAVVLLLWAALALFAQALRLHRERRRLGLPPTRIARAPPTEAGTATQHPRR